LSARAASQRLAVWNAARPKLPPLLLLVFCGDIAFLLSRPLQVGAGLRCDSFRGTRRSFPVLSGAGRWSTWCLFH